MPKFLFITILILVFAGHTFAVKEYSPEKIENKDAIHLKDISFDEKNKDYEPIEIIESPIVGEKTRSIFIREGGECIFFDNEGIPWLDRCPVEFIE